MTAPKETYVDEFFGDAVHRFDLHAGSFDRLTELQEKTGDGPFVTFKRLRDGEWRVVDVSETIRIGLIGGGASPSVRASRFRPMRRWQRRGCRANCRTGTPAHRRKADRPASAN